MYLQYGCFLFVVGENRRSIRNQFVAQIHNCETARDMRETAVSRWGVSRETARDSVRQRETARDSARQPRILREYVQQTGCV
jgi:hypothetical protein